ncbi:MAG: RNA 2',3'-cyclic phosphodiesterase [Deltaproteobacteria bacterium]|nr:MAG: RNA 2',3'-cyclic phosphodiesterase [Deltaproteobacteria bacterium]
MSNYKKRLFVAIDLPEPVKERLKPLCWGLPGARWTDMHQLHLTLCFIGEVEGVVYLDVRQALGDIRFSSFSMQLDGLGFFPPRGRPQVVWAGVAPCERLKTLREKIYNRLLAEGVSLEKRKFVPHITLARLKNTPPKRAGLFLEEYGLFYSEPFTVKRFLLYSSVLGRKGARHTVEQEYVAGRNTV